jgi:hypothetical protein
MHLGEGEGLPEKESSTGGEELGAKYQISFGGHHHYGNTFQPSLRLHMTDEIETLEMRHIHVEYRRRKIGISVKNSVGFTAIKGRNHLIAVII